MTTSSSRRTLTLLIVLVAFPVSRAAAQDEWSRFRGPNGTGVSATTGLPTEFGPEQNVVWKTPLPPGHSSPVLTATRIFLTAHTAEKETYRLFVPACDRTGVAHRRHSLVRGTQDGNKGQVDFS